jgi:Ni,Fe-hydrogenase I large subunit
MTKYQKAIIEVEPTLKQTIYTDAFDILQLLTLYVEVLDTCNRKFPTQHAHLVEEMANNLSIDLSSLDLEESEQLSQIIKDISQANSLANKRYSELISQLNQIKNKNKKIFLLQKYILEESFKFYRNLAIKNLENLTIMA